MTRPIPDEVCRAAAQMILRAAGSDLKHYMPDSQTRIVEATRNVMQSVADHADGHVREALDAMEKCTWEGE